MTWRTMSKQGVTLLSCLMYKPPLSVPHPMIFPSKAVTWILGSRKLDMIWTWEMGGFIHGFSWLVGHTSFWIMFMGSLKLGLKLVFIWFMGHVGFWVMGSLKSGFKLGLRGGKWGECASYKNKGRRENQNPFLFDFRLFSPLHCCFLAFFSFPTPLLVRP